MILVLEPRADGGVDLVVTGDWSWAAREAVESGRADGVVLNYARGFREQPIDFLRGMPIRKVDLLARSVSDLSPVYSLGRRWRSCSCSPTRGRRSIWRTFLG